MSMKMIFTKLTKYIFHVEESKTKLACIAAH